MDVWLVRHISEAIYLAIIVRAVPAVLKRDGAS